MTNGPAVVQEPSRQRQRAMALRFFMVMVEGLEGLMPKLGKGIRRWLARVDSQQFRRANGVRTSTGRSVFQQCRYDSIAPDVCPELRDPHSASQLCFSGLVVGKKRGQSCRSEDCPLHFCEVEKPNPCFGSFLKVGTHPTC